MDVSVITALISVASVAVGSLITLLSQYIVEKVKYGYEIKNKRRDLAINVYKLSIKFLQTLAKFEVEKACNDTDKLDSLSSHKDTLRNKIEEDIFIALSIEGSKKIIQSY